MNSHMAQSVQTMSELMDFCAVPFHIISPKDGKPVITFVQDTLLGSFRLTKKDVFIADKTFANLQMVNSYFDGTMPKAVTEEGKFNGQQAYSQILPPGIWMDMKFDAPGKKEPRVVSIKNSVLQTSGNLDKACFNSLSKGLIPVIFHDHGPFETRRFMDNTQRLICRWLMSSGFSVGISDLIIKPEDRAIVTTKIDEVKRDVFNLIGNARNDKLNNHSLFNNNDYFEMTIIGKLNDVTKIGESMIDTLDDNTNRMLNMIKAGSKGNHINVAQMVACVGQQNVDSKRIAYGFTDRTLPHYNKFDDGPAARGFVENSFINGLTPQEVYFHAMGGREGMIDTAVKSVSYDTKILIIENEKPIVIEIGKWIDNYLDNKTNKTLTVQYGQEDANMELLDLTKIGINTKIVSCDNNGVINWHNITNVTRHDPSEYIYKIKTKWGRKVDVVASKSLLIWNDSIKAFEPKDSEDVKIGDKMPVTFNCPDLFSDNEKIIKYIKNYISANGIITDKCIELSDTEGIIYDLCYLLTRFGIFSEIYTNENIYIAMIKSKYMHKLLALIGLPNNNEIENIYEEHNDVILDKIVSIDKVLSEGAKVYDLTVPDTLNFQIFNGLNIRDTSETGYLQRRLVKAMEDCKVYYDNTIRNATGSIVQFLYGEDGMDGTKIENQALRYTDMSIIEMEEAYHLRKDDNLEIYLNKDAMKEVDETRDWANRCTNLFDEMIDDKEFIMVKIFKNRVGSGIQYPIPFARIIRVASERIKESGLAAVQTDLTPMYILDNIERLLKDLKVARNETSIRFLEILLRLYLNPKQLIIKAHLNIGVFDWVCDEITRYFKEAIVQPGEMVGIVAAQTIGEYSTQMTLNSFHLSGTSAASKATRGVPRLKELLGVTQNMKAPSLTIYLKEDIAVEESNVPTDESNAKRKATAVRNSLEISKLSDILDYTEIYWDPPGNSGFETGIEADINLMKNYKNFAKENFSDNCQSPWVLRMKLNRAKMHNIGLTMLDIYVKMKEMYGSSLCLFSDDNDEEMIFRIRMDDTSGDTADADDAIAVLKAIEWNLVHHKLLKGTEGILKVGMRQSKEEKRYNQVTKTATEFTEWIMDTDGTNLIEILSNKNIDSVRTVSNDVCEIYEVLGVEGGRQALLNEISEVIKESGINYRHVSLLVDTMTNRGFLMPIDRHGINRGDVGPLGKCSFEETTDMLIKASIFSEYDKINGVSANIMLGQMPPCGTGDCDVLLDEERYISLLRGMKKKDNPIEWNEMPDEVKESCSSEAIGFTFQLPDTDNVKPVPLQTVKWI